MKEKGQLGYLLRQAPIKEDPTYIAWDEEDFMIMHWLWDFMDISISDTRMFLISAKEILDCVQQTYSKARNVAHVYEIKIIVFATKQGEKSVTGYANSLQSL